MSARNCRCLLLTLALVLGVEARAETTAATPMEAAKKTMTALRMSRYEEFAASMHPEALKAFQSLLMTVVEAAAREGKQGEVLQMLDGSPSLEAVRRMTPAQFYASFVKGVMEKLTDVKEATTKSNIRFLGQVAEGPVVHVVYRMSMQVQGTSITLPGVVSLKKHGAGWASLLTGEFQGLAQTLAMRFGPDKKVPTPGKPAPTVLGQIKEGKNQVHVVVRWTTPVGAAKVSKLSAHSVGPKDAAWKLLGNRAALQKHMAQNYGPM